jgi:hypothetical protein
MGPMTLFFISQTAVGLLMRSVVTQKVMLQLMVGQCVLVSSPVWGLCLLLFCRGEAPSLTRRRVCHLSVCLNLLVPLALPIKPRVRPNIKHCSSFLHHLDTIPPLHKVAIT